MNANRETTEAPEIVNADPVREERERLEQTLQEIERQLSQLGPAYFGDDFVLQALDAKRAETLARLQLLEREPYFGRLDFAEAEKRQEPKEPAPLYIGKRGMDRKDTNEPYIIDWRAPVASLFYSFTGGDEPVSYEAPEGTIYGEVHRKRNVSIREKTLQRVVDSYVRGGDNLGLRDEFLLYRLGEKKDNRLRDIVSTIQAEQDRIIRAPRHSALVIQGAAGSGKTTVALHRLAFLLYQYQGQMRAERMIIFAPNTMFLDYISGVLPELGVGNVRQTTFLEWALNRLGGRVKLEQRAGESARWFSLHTDRPAVHDELPERFKGSLRFKQWLDAKLSEREASFLPELAFEAWDGRVLPVRTIREWFEVEYRHYPLAKRRERLIGRMNRWLEMQLKDIGDAKIRKAIAKTGKQRLKAYAKKLPEADELLFYRSLFERPDGFVPEPVAAQTKAYLMKGRAAPEDLPALLWIRLYFHGPEEPPFDHIVLDEAQDVPPFQIALLNAMMTEPSFTILGDLAQGIHAYRGVLRWEELTEAFPPERSSYHELKMSYRSTLEIIEFANLILPFTDTALPPAQPVFRSGDPVELARLNAPDERTARIRSFIEDNSKRGMRTIAVIGRTAETCAHISRQLDKAGVESHLIAEDQLHYQGGVSVVPAHLAKGLEFDAVLVVDADDRHYAADPQDAKLLYVACTRALHRLTLLYEGTLTPLVASSM